MGVNHMASLDQTYSGTAQAVAALNNVTCAKDSDKQLVVCDISISLLLNEALEQTINTGHTIIEQNQYMLYVEIMISACGNGIYSIYTDNPNHQSGPSVQNDHPNNCAHQPSASKSNTHSSSTVSCQSEPDNPWLNGFRSFPPRRIKNMAASERGAALKPYGSQELTLTAPLGVDSTSGITLHPGGSGEHSRGGSSEGRRQGRWGKGAASPPPARPSLGRAPQARSAPGAEVRGDARASGEGGAMLTPGSREPTTRCRRQQAAWLHELLCACEPQDCTKTKARTRAEGPHRQRVREGRRGVPQKQLPRCKQEAAAQR